MEQVNGEQIWNALEKDVSFLRSIPEGKPRELWREYLDRLPAVLAGHLDKPVTLSSLIGAKLAYTRDALETGFVRRLVEAYPDEAFGIMSAADMAEMAEDALKAIMPQLEEVLKDVPAWLEENGVSEDDVIVAKAKLNANASALYRRGKLTVGGLLCLQPTVILKNTD